MNTFKALKEAFFRPESQLSFSQIRSRKRIKFKKEFIKLGELFVFLMFYLYLKIKRLVRTLLFIVAKMPEVFKYLKFNLTRKLIWGRGRLTKPFVSFSLVGLLLGVFLTGGFYQHRFVIAEEKSPEFISGVGDIIPERITATTILPSGRIRDTDVSYEVKSGDTMTSIGQEFGVTVETIRYANNITDIGIGLLKVGQKLNIPPVTGVIHTVDSGDTINSLAEKYEVATQAIADFNYLNEPFALAVGQKLIIPDAKIPRPAPAAPPPLADYGSDAYVTIPYSASGNGGSGSFIWPTRYKVITQYFSWYHPAIDIGRISPIYASDGGTVVRSGWWANGYGFAVQIDHGNGFVTTYAHMSVLDVSVGDNVYQGQVLGMMGSTGRSTGPHVHFTTQYNGQFLNPLEYL